MPPTCRPAGPLSVPHPVLRLFSRTLRSFDREVILISASLSAPERISLGGCLIWPLQMHLGLMLQRSRALPQLRAALLSNSRVPGGCLLLGEWHFYASHSHIRSHTRTRIRFHNRTGHLQQESSAPSIKSSDSNS